MAFPQEGSKAPDFTAVNQDGEEISLNQFLGKKVILFFYPQDNTPTCTIEACNLRDNYQALVRKGFVVLGISPDKEKKHKNFIAKYNLNYPLITDPDLKVHELYGTWGDKVLFGRKYKGTLRTTFIIDEKGKIQKVIEKVESKRHTAQILQALA
jgi:peroxiredoxin Q/BCP